MMLNKVSAAEYGNPELAEKVSRVQRLTSGEYDRELYGHNEASLMKLLQGILRISRQEGDWFLYFYSLGEMMLLADDCYKIVKCAEVYYRDIDLYGGKEVFYHAVTSLYGGVWYYYEREMDLGLLYWDEDMAEHGKK